MISDLTKTPLPFLTRKRKIHIPITLIRQKKFDSWKKKQTKGLKDQISASRFGPKGAQVFIARDNKGQPQAVFAGIHDTLELYDLSKIAKEISGQFSDNALKTQSFEIAHHDLNDDELSQAHIGWALAAYQFEIYKENKNIPPHLVWAKGTDKVRVTSMVESLCLLKNLINTPANDLGPDNLDKLAKAVAKAAQAKTKVVKGEKLLEENFPLIHMVGKASDQDPRLLEMNWGKKTDPKVTIIGKGVTFDTGGLNLKPTQYMRLMKKDMGGAAHAIALGKLVMEAKLPIQLTVLLPIVENAISDNAFRPGDIAKSRKGITVENTNTDAEGRLILADTLTYASESKPELIIDYATLTGSARAALGPDMPAFFCTSDKTAAKLQKLGKACGDPVWQMPLWESYKKHIRSHSADVLNSASIPGDLIYSALFLQEFLVNNPEWIHLDVFAWEQHGFAGRPMGGADTGLRAVFALLEDRYGT